MSHHKKDLDNTFSEMMSGLDDLLSDISLKDSHLKSGKSPISTNKKEINNSSKSESEATSTEKIRSKDATAKKFEKSGCDSLYNSIEADFEEDDDDDDDHNDNESDEEVKVTSSSNNKSQEASKKTKFNSSNSKASSKKLSESSDDDSDDSDLSDGEMDEIIYKRCRKASGVRVSEKDNCGSPRKKDKEANVDTDLEEAAPTTTDDGTPICDYCRVPIQGTYFTNGVQFWHNNHFKCSICSTFLEDQQFYYEDNRLFCKTDFLLKNSERCGTCNQYIEDIFAESMGMKFHVDHFICSACEENLLDKQHFVVDSSLFCLKCHGKLLSKKCKRCGGVIEQKCITVSKFDYHDSCFRCFECADSLRVDKFVIKGGEVYCNKHVKSHDKSFICATCGEQITSLPTQVNGKYYHPEHITCEVCHTSLLGQSYKVSKRGAYVCQACSDSSEGYI